MSRAVSHRVLIDGIWRAVMKVSCAFCTDVIEGVDAMGTAGFTGWATPADGVDLCPRCAQNFGTEKESE